MKERLFITTAIGLLLGTAAFAQSPSEQPRTNSPAAAQSQTNSNQSPAPAASSNSSSQSSTSSQSSPSESSTPSAQNAQSTPSATSKSGTTTTSQSGAGTAGTGNNGSAASQAQSNSPSSQSSQPSQAQSSPPSNASSQAQTSPATNPSASTNNQSQASPSGSNGNSTNSTSGAGAQPSTNTAAQPNNQTNTAQSRSPNVSVSANLNENQRTRVSESIARLNVAPLNNVNFALSVGTVVPRDVRFQALPTDIVEAMPQYRGYDFFVAHDDIVIVEPSSYKIVDVLPRGGRSAAAAPAPRQTTFSERDREVIRKHARSRTEQHTTGSVASTRVRVGDRLPESVEIRSFPDEAYRESPALREYRYIERDNRTYVVEPRERTIIEEVE
ncbi:MAG: hypothetical protein QOF22_2482 [Bradyrhizobium sp.]|jgi:hypothetical protein|nr:hypothetical protein [Bradyrhizobium sp.]